MFSFFVYAVNFKVFRIIFQIPDHIIKPGKRVKLHICVKGIPEIRAGNGKALQLAEVDAAVSNAGQCPGQAAAGMIGMKIDRSLAGIFYDLSKVFVLQDQEAGIVILLRMNIGGQYIQRV